VVQAGEMCSIFRACDAADAAGMLGGTQMELNWEQAVAAKVGWAGLTTSANSGEEQYASSLPLLTDGTGNTCAQTTHLKGAHKPIHIGLHNTEQPLKQSSLRWA
jgi:hypothetical protein